MVKISSVSAHDTISNLEKRLDLYRYQYDGWSIWSVLRFPLAFYMSDPGEKVKERKKRIKKWLKRIVFIIRDFPIFLFPPHRDVLVKTASTMNREVMNGKFKDYFLDDYLSLNSHSYFKLEVMNRENFYLHSEHALIPSNMTTTFIDLLAYTAAKFFNNSEAKKTAAEIYQDICEEAGEWISEKDIETLLLHFHWEKRLYAHLLKHITPKYVLVTNFLEYALVAAAKEAHIPIVEFQHGRADWFYGPPATKASQENYSRLLIPDRIFLFGDYWKEQLARCGSYRDQLRVVGSTTLDIYRKRKKSSTSKKADNICTLLLTTDYYRQDLVDILEDFLKLAEDQLEIHLILKLHPSYDLDAERYLRAFNYDRHVSVYTGDEFPTTAELLIGSDFHLSVNSTCHYEALALQVPTIVLGVLNYELVLHLVDEGHAFLAKNAAELLDTVIKNWKKFTVPDEVSEWYYKSDALENISQELAKIEL